MGAGRKAAAAIDEYLRTGGVVTPDSPRQFHLLTLDAAAATSFGSVW